MSKKILAFTAAILTGPITTGVFAQEAYIGIGAGGTGVFNHTTQTVIDPGIFDDGVFGAAGTLYVGYTFPLMSKYQLSLEAVGNLFSATMAEYIPTIPDTTYTKYRYSYGIRVLPAYQVSQESNIHFIAGYSRGNFNVQDTLHARDNNFNVSAYQVGLGSKLELCQNLFVRGDIIYNGYQSKTIASTIGAIFTDQMSTFDGIVSLGYSFG